MDDSHGILKLFDEIESSVDQGLYYVAMMALLTVPDHMAALSDPSGETSKKRYISWYSENVESPLTPEDAYGMRCSMLHQARSSTKNDAASGVRKVAFAEPSRLGKLKTGYMAGSVMVIGVPDLCDAIIGAARQWLTANDGDSTVQANLDKTLIRAEASHGSQGRQVNTGIMVVMSVD
jgi:hypothetical protein